MSGFLLVNLKENTLSYDDFDELSRRLIGFALKNHLGITFNSNDYGKEIIEEEKIRDYFHVSESFLYKNCDFLDMPSLILELCGVDSIEEIDFDHYPTKASIKEAFLKKFNFLNEIFDIVFEYGVNAVEVFLTESYGPIFFSDDFSKISTTRKNFLPDLFDSLVDVMNNDFNYQFPSARFYMSK